MAKDNDNEKKKEGEVVEGVWEFSVDTPPKDIVLGTSSASGSMRPWEEEEVVEVVQKLEKLSLTGIRFNCDLEKGFGLEITRDPTLIKTIVRKKKR